MFAPINPTFTRQFQWNKGSYSLRRFVFIFVFLIGIVSAFDLSVAAQGPVNGSFYGTVRDSAGNPISNAQITFRNQTNGFQVRAISNERGEYTKNTLPPGDYEITVEAPDFQPATVRKTLLATRLNEVLPPIELTREQATNITVPNPNPTPTPTNITGNTPTPSANNVEVAANKDTDTTIVLNPRRDGAFDERAVRSLPLGGNTLTRTFDELAFYVPGVVPPPQAIGNSVGPGVGGGVGTSGQFSVNGLRSRANNFTVDGSDNNDEDIGVRRQGFFTLVPQPIESIQEFTIITLLAPAEFGRNLGAQVNVNSKGGGNRFNGTIFGLGNADFLNARNFFDNAGGDSSVTLQSLQFGNLVDVCFNAPIGAAVCPAANRRLVTNDAGEKDTFSLLQGGFALGGPIVRDKLFFFGSAEGQWLNATTEKHFAVPTVEQRGLFNTGSTGLEQCLGLIDPREGVCFNPNNGQIINFIPGFPTSLGGGDEVFSLIPFPNDPTGIFGRNTYTQALSGDARGGILSGRIDYNFSLFDRPQVFTARYNFTDDRRDLTDVGGAIFSAIRPLVRTDNFSSFLSGSITNNLSNELRFSWGRTRLRFEELRDTTGFLEPVDSSRITSAKERQFLLNAQVFLNSTLPTGCDPVGCFAAPFTNYRATNQNTGRINGLGEIGQLIIAGFSPIGVDVFNFPQERINDTFQFADTLRWQFNAIGQHSLAFGTDIRRVFLKSNLPRNSRPLVTFNGGLDGFNILECLEPNRPADLSCFVEPTDLAAAGAATGFFQSIVLPGRNAEIDLGYYQLNFFAQDEWRIRSNLVLSYGLRYEFNTVPREADNKIENSFTDAQLSLIPDLNQFINGRRQIYDSDRDNFAPRLAFAAALSPKTVIRGGGGMYFDQIVGSVVSQSRNVFPTFTTVNFGGGLPNALCLTGDNPPIEVPCTDPRAFSRVHTFSLFNPLTTGLGTVPIIQAGTLNTFNPNLSLPNFLNAINSVFPSFGFLSGNRNSSFGATLPQRNLEIPFSYQYFASIEQELFNNTFISAAYVGTTGRNLLRFTTPNLGSNYIAVLSRFDLEPFILPDGTLFGVPLVRGLTLDPNIDPNANVFAGRPVANVGPINQFETTGSSQYHSGQVGIRGRFARNFQYQANYVFGKVLDDVSDVFDLAGAYALPQNSRDFAGEYAPANFDVRHRFTYNFIYDAPSLRNQNGIVRYLLGDWQIAGTGKFNTGQPFTVNSIYDVNLDGNLTDRLDNTRFITETGDRRQPLRLTSDSGSDLQTMLATIGQNGSIPRNSFRAGKVLELDMSFAKRFSTVEEQSLEVRFDVFNFINRANFGVPVRILEFPSFGKAVETITPGRRIQLLLRYNF